MAKLLSTHRSLLGSLLILGVLMPVLLMSSLTPTRATPESIRVATALNKPVDVAVAGVELSPGYKHIATSGSIIAYTHTLTNTGTNTDTFTLDVSSSQGWPVSLLSETGPLSLPLQLDAGVTTSFMISLSVPTFAISGTVDMAVITATSQTSPTVLAVAVDTTTVNNATWLVYLPVVLKRWPPIPNVPVLNPINNPSNEGTYNVTWNAAYLATSYTVEEDDNASFSSPTIQPVSSDTAWLVTGRSSGTYYYRVKAVNAWGESGWSNIQSVAVLPSVTLYSIADTFVLQGYSTNNYNSYGVMYAGYNDVPFFPAYPDLISRSQIQFNVSAIPPGTTISSAILRVYLISSYDYRNETLTITTYRISSSWSESSVTWDTRPSYTEAYGSALVTHEAWGWYSFDVTNLVRGWMNGAIPNYGVMLRGLEVSGSDPSVRGFSTREGNYSPQLVITYSGSSASIDAQSNAGNIFKGGIPRVSTRTWSSVPNALLCRNQVYLLAGEKRLALP